MKMKDKRDVLSKSLKDIKMHSAGEKHNMDIGLCSEGPKKDYVNYPSLYLSAKQAPSLKKHDLNDEIIMVIKAKMTSHSLNESPNRKNESFSLEIREIGSAASK